MQIVRFFGNFPTISSENSEFSFLAEVYKKVRNKKSVDDKSLARQTTGSFKNAARHFFCYHSDLTFRDSFRSNA